MKHIIVTNNSYVYEEFKGSIEIVFDENFTYLDVLKSVRDKVHDGYELATHPLSGSVKPNETPYKTVILKGEKGNLDFSSLQIIEDSIATTKKFISNSPTPVYSQDILDDFKTIDFSLIKNVLDKVVNI